MVVYECCECLTRQVAFKPDPPAKCINCLVGFAFLRVLYSSGSARECAQEVVQDGKTEYSNKGHEGTA